MFTEIGGILELSLHTAPGYDLFRQIILGCGHYLGEFTGQTTWVTSKAFLYLGIPNDQNTPEYPFIYG